MFGLLGDENFRRCYTVIITKMKKVGDDWVPIPADTELPRVYSSKDNPPLNVSFDIVSAGNVEGVTQSKVTIENISVDGLGNTLDFIFDNDHLMITLMAGYGEDLVVIGYGNMIQRTFEWTENGNVLSIFFTFAYPQFVKKDINKSYNAPMSMVELVRMILIDAGIFMKVISTDPKMLAIMLKPTKSLGSAFVAKGKLKDVLEQLRKKYGFQWLSKSLSGVDFIELFVDKKFLPPTKFIELSSASGLVGIPSWKGKGNIEIKMLLRNDVMIGDVVNVTFGKLLTLNDSTGNLNMVRDMQKASRKIGRIRVMEVLHKGEYYGGEWYTTIRGTKLGDIKSED